jgi:hypothetical protein
MPDVALNRPLTVGAVLNDAFGQPQTSGASGTLTVVGPAGTQVFSGAASALTAEGVWGAVIPGTAHTVAGSYAYTLTPTDGAGDGALTGVYSAGTIEPDQLPLWDIYLAVGDALRDVRDGRATQLTVASNVATLTDPYYAYGTANNWNGQHVLLPYTSAVTDSNPLRVASFDPNSGAFTLKPAGAAVPAAPLRYLMGGLSGFTHRQKLSAIQRAIRDARPRLGCSDQTTLAGTIFNFEYALPASWASVHAVYLRNKVSAWQGDWQAVAPIHWRVRRDRRLLVIDYGLTSLVQIRIDGRYEPPLPQFWQSYVDAPAEFVISRALEYLCATSPEAEHKQMLQYYVAKAQEAMPTMTPLANEVRL